MNNKVAAFGQRRAGVYLLSEIYDPDNVTSSIQNINKVIPAIGSLVVDDTVGEHNLLYVVYSVDAVTHKSTLVRAGTSLIDDDDNTDLRMLFFNPTPVETYYTTRDTERQSGTEYYTKSGNTYTLYTGTLVSGTTYYEKKMLYNLAIDSRISVYTTSATKYIIYRTTSLTSVTGSTEVISQFYKDGDNVIENCFIPMESIVIPSVNNQGQDIACDAKRPKDCYTDIQPVTGDKYLVVVYGEGDHIISQFVLTGHSMSALTDLNRARRVIVGMTVNSTQHDGDNFYILQNQDPREVPFDLVLTYSDNSHEIIPIDNNTAFAIMEENLSSVAEGSEIDVVFKYFPSPTEALDTLNDTNNPDSIRNYKIGETGRYIAITRKITVRKSVSSEISKISPILYYNNSKYNILPMVYMTDRSESQSSRNVPGHSVKTVVGFSGVATGQQTVTLNFFKQESGTIETVSRSYLITLTANDINGIYYTYRDSVGANVIYGKSPRPKLTRVVNEDPLDTSISYKFNSTVETGQYSAADLFLKYYYYNASPPVPYSGSSARQPTHFRIRKLNVTNWENQETDADAIPIVSEEIPIQTFFAKEESLRNVGVTEALAEYADKPGTAIVEFLYKDMLIGRSEVLYGVGVDVVEANPQAGT